MGPHDFDGVVLTPQNQEQVLSVMISRQGAAVECTLPPAPPRSGQQAGSERAIDYQPPRIVTDRHELTSFRFEE
jgi:hypothetical protein